MNINTLVIENFRGIENLAIQLDSLTVLIGENNTCKTTVLDALSYCLGPAIRRRAGVFEPDDYRYGTPNAMPGDAGPIRLTIKMSESTPGEWPVEIKQDLNEAIQPDGITGAATVTFQVTSEKQGYGFVTKWAFLNHQGEPLEGASATQTILQTFQRFLPFFMIAALRDASKEFSARSSYWGPFVRDLQMTAEEIRVFEDSINTLNSDIIGKHGSLGAVQEEVSRAAAVLGPQCGSVSIDALPVRLTDVIGRSTVNLETPTGAKLPLARHGSGLQSLSVFLLFQAFVKQQLQKTFDEFATAVVAIEEPETHLHPAASRTFSNLLHELPGQKLMTTHSGEIAGACPLSSIRRLYLKDGKIALGSFDPSTMDDRERRKIDFFIRATRGEMLFARVWVLGEGQTEYWLLHYAAQALNIDLDLGGIRFVEYAQCGLDELLKVADQLGIQWLLFSDSDEGGQKNITKAVEALNGRNASDHILEPGGADCMETYLMANGYEALYESLPHWTHVQNIAASKGQADYHAKLYKLLNTHNKLEGACRIGEDWLESPDHVPALLRYLLEKALALGGGA